MSKGKVKYFNDVKGWGFISPDRENRDVYVHYRNINMEGYKTLREGQQVVFDLSITDHGPEAHNVQPYQ